MEGTQIFVSLVLLCFSGFCAFLYEVLWLRAERLRKKLRQQGIRGPPPSFPYGNFLDMKRIKSAMVGMSPLMEKDGSLTSDYTPVLFPYLELWRKEYGPIFTYATGNVQHIYITDPNLVKEISLHKSWDLGKPSYVIEQLGALLGHGVTMSNGHVWAHQRKLIAPEFFIDKVKGMVGLMVETTLPLLKLWEDQIEGGGGLADIRVDEDLINLSADVISRACFGSTYSDGKEIFSLFKRLQSTMSGATIFIRIPYLRYLPTKSNREAWRLEQEIEKWISESVTKRREQNVASTEKDLLQMILEAANADKLEQKTANRLVLDNCKNIYVAGHETVSSAATWALMLLASHPEWQSRIRTEVTEVFGDGLPNADMLHKMKTLTMVIQETLRLYPPSSFIAREAFKEKHIDELCIPKGVNLWIPIATLHRLPEIWGPDSDEFKPERFAQGISGACKLPQMYMPFGLGPRTCLGQKFAMVELKIILSLIVSKFSFSLSPNYIHSPAFKLVIQPEYGINLLIRGA
ncbi:PREDICTED: cytochrome P450 714C2-like [Nelumbo nucifera]|uniref:Cytochrome P450 714C2-like n=2 Tax=Nelumbo nucifera TaxID=4432 RepID=A0A822ZR39_NELNU|nr:PREDICTED: cytochrome P450 714C2-like [Nelumbo nucifera]DAD45406.1 TPA_asm: hypothetical protein HUJ06_003636 [Nelumbo nucifera]